MKDRTRKRKNIPYLKLTVDAEGFLEYYEFLQTETNINTLINRVLISQKVQSTRKVCTSAAQHP